jgi:segregation and condensation protein A
VSAASEFRDGLDVGEATFTVDLDGFEGPLHLLLELAQRQKIDLTRISVLALAEQYLLFIDVARKLRLEVAADYLVMAAWLAFLKSRLLLPSPKAAEPDASELAEALSARLRKLESIRKAAEHLINRPRLGRDFFARGNPERVEIAGRLVYQANLYELLTAYARQVQKRARSSVRLTARAVWSLAEARERLTRLLGLGCDWTAFDEWLLEACADPGMRRSARASTFSASLELVREGKLELRQEKTFAPIWVRPASAPAAGGALA